MTHFGVKKANYYRVYGPIAAKSRDGIGRTTLSTLRTSIVAALLFIPGSVLAASFDCQRASNAAEKLVCSTPVLSQLDEDLSKSYEQALKSHSVPSKLKHEQLNWLREVRNRCADVTCLESAYRSRLAVLEQASIRQRHQQKEKLSDPQAPSPLRALHSTDEFSPVDYPIRKRDKRIIFSQYDQSGNSFEVVAFNFTTLKSERLVRGLRGGQYIAQSDEYLIIGKREGGVRPLLVLDRNSNKVIGQIKLRRPITWAKIEGDRLIAIQGGFGVEAGYTASCEALVFELPSLKIVKHTEIIGGNDVQTWNGLILSLGYDLAAYDENLNEVFKITLPQRKRGERVSCAPTGPLRIYEHMAVVVANCGDIWIFDLSKRALAHTIPSYSMFYAVAVMDRLLFTAPKGTPRQRDNAHVFDLSTGQEVAVLPINATDLFAVGNRLLAVERKFAKPSPMTVYAVDTVAIRNGKWREQKILSECQKAQALLASSKDIYRAIDMCASTGIEGVIIDGKMPATLMVVARQYALWLSETLDLARHAIPILEELIESDPTEILKRALANAKLKAAVLDGRATGPLTESEQDTQFARILEDGRWLKAPETKNIFFGTFPNLFHFSGQRVYVGRYANGASIGVLDRRTLAEIADVRIAPDDDTYQDHIVSIATDETRLYASLGYRYAQAGRPNLFVVDKSSLKIIKEAYVLAPLSLIMDGDTLLACACHFTSGHSCKAIDRTTFETRDVRGICVQNEQGDHRLVSSSTLKTHGKRYVAATQDFLIATKRWRRETPYIVSPKGGGDSRTIEYGASDSLSWPKAIEGNLVITTEAKRNGTRIKEVDASTGSVRTLLGVPTSSFRGPVIAVKNGILYVGFGRDLIVYDLSRDLVVRYIRDYIVAAPNEASNIDANSITRLIIDEGRLIALTSRGQNSRVARLEDLTR